MRWSFRNSNLTWYQYGWAILPSGLVAVGGLIGGLCAAVAVPCNLYLMRGEFKPALKYALSGIVTLTAGVAYFALVPVLTVHFAATLVTVESVDRDLQKAPVFVAMKKADAGVYAGLVEQLTNASRRRPEDILAAVAQHEREMISERTRLALQAAKARGTKLGNPNISHAAKLAVDALKATADQFAANVLPVIREIQAQGVSSHNAIAATLNARGVKTARGGKWAHVQVGAVLARA